MSDLLPKPPGAADSSARLRTADERFKDDRFADLTPIGRGSMGVVYRAFDKKRRQTVALKTLPAVDPEQIFWLKNEFRILADVRHRNLVELHDLRVTTDTGFFTMELVDGSDFVSCAHGLLSTEPGAVGESAERITRLDDIVAQLVRGIQAIHDAGKLHRDIKPSNVLVTHAGRVVVLDFGLALPMERAADAAERYSFAGTPLYMAPEQLFGEPLSPASDWYALGIVLFEAFTGSLPFEGTVGEVFERKRRGAPDVRSRNPSIPEYLAAVVACLLDPDPKRRPDGGRILTTLESSAGRETSGPPEERFVGRVEELAALEGWFGEGRAATVVAHVQGESGIGKTALLQHFVARVASHGGALVLRGRCHPRESLPYKALDGVIDHLTALLLRDRACADVVVRDRSPSLERLFPVLGRLWSTPAENATEPLLDPVEARRVGAEAFAGLLKQVATVRPLVIWIDDLQWGDADSAAVLRSILAGTSPPPMLLLLSYRSEDVARSPLLTEIADLPLEGPSSCQRALRVEPLAPAQAADLARMMLQDAPSPDTAIEVARDAGGSPFFIRELARHRRSTSGAAARLSRLEDIVSGRLEGLPAAARRVLELLSLSATTLTTQDTVDAAGVGGDAYSFLRLLESEGYVRLSPVGADQGVEPYHDRIRESVVARIDAPALVLHHRALAEVLERSSRRDPEALLTHHLGAGNAPAALHYARLAADRAASTLAFDRAASHYRTALGLISDPGERRTLLGELAEALNSAGRTGEAADRFLEAARLGETAAIDGMQLRRLQRRASECLLRSGRWSEGRELMWRILRSVDAPLPRSERDALLRGTLTRLPLLAGPLPKARPNPKDLSESSRERLDVLWAAAICLSWEPLTSSFFRARYVREALPTNDPLLVAAAFGAEAASQGAMRWAFLRRRGNRLLARMEELASALNDPYTTAHAASVRAHNAFFCGRWREALESGDREIELLRRHCHGVSWELAVAQIFSLLALSFLGEMKALRTRLDAALLDASERGDQFAVGNLHLGQHNFCRLVTDEASEALEQAEVLGRTMPTDRFGVQHYHHVVLVTQCHLYLGDPLAAWRTIDGVWARLKAAQFLQLAFTSVELVHLRARAALALAADRGSSRSSSLGVPSARELQRLVEGASKAIRKSDAPPAAPLAATLDAALARLRGDDDQLARSLRSAVTGFEHADMGLHAATARWAIEAVVGRDDTRVRRNGSATVDAEAVRPEAIAATLLPGVVR